MKVLAAVAVAYGVQSAAAQGGVNCTAGLERAQQTLAGGHFSGPVDVDALTAKYDQDEQHIHDTMDLAVAKHDSDMQKWHSANEVQQASLEMAVDKVEAKCDSLEHDEAAYAACMVEFNEAEAAVEDFFEYMKTQEQVLEHEFLASQETFVHQLAQLKADYEATISAPTSAEEAGEAVAKWQTALETGSVRDHGRIVALCDFGCVQRRADMVARIQKINDVQNQITAKLALPEYKEAWDAHYDYENPHRETPESLSLWREVYGLVKVRNAFTKPKAYQQRIIDEFCA